MTSTPSPSHHLFSRITVRRDGLDPAHLFDLMHGNAYREHALLWRLFPGEGRPRDFVFRAERDPRGLPQYYVVSKREPRPVAGALHVDIHPRPYPPDLETGMRLHFRLRANPTTATREELGSEALAQYNARRAAMSEKPPKSHHGRREFHDVIMAAKKACGHVKGWKPSRSQRDEFDRLVDQAARAWLLDRLPRWGLTICERGDYWSDDPGPALRWDAYYQHRLPRGGGMLQFSSIDYEGEVQVFDPNLLRQALVQGVGRAKAFGCGLLLVRPVV
ncbi:MAG: type I-E CRISPR-associated protein Cas6/Cse3/CasE [Rubrivivax sp.]|nr:type I-E CRISPR-associated protein Cas6/Cse3/CasE [Rubrivivax sp.]